MKVTRYVQQYDTQMSVKQWELRNAAARHLLEQKATSLSKVEPIGTIAKATGADASSIRRVLEKAPGFTTLKHANGGGLRTVGVCYDVQFLKWATDIDPADTYPRSLHELSKAIITRGVEIPMEVILERFGENTAAAVVLDPDIEKVFTGNSVNIDGHVAVPVAQVAAIPFEQAIEGYSSGKMNEVQFLAHFVSRYWLNKEQEKVT